MKIDNAGPFAIGAGFAAASISTNLFTAFINGMKRSSSHDEEPYEYYYADDVEKMMRAWRKREAELEFSSTFHQLSAQQNCDKAIASQQALATRAHINTAVTAFKGWLSKKLCAKYQPEIAKTLTGEVPAFANCCIYAAVEFFANVDTDTYYLGALAAHAVANPGIFTSEESAQLSKRLTRLSVKGVAHCTSAPEEGYKAWGPLFERLYTRGYEIWGILTAEKRRNYADPNVTSELFNQTRHRLATQGGSLNLTRSLWASVPATGALAKQIVALEKAPYRNGSYARDQHAFERGQAITLCAEGSLAGRQVILAPRAN